MRLCLLLVLVVAMGIPATTNGAQGGLIASDGFDYAGGDLSGQDGGSGFAGPWRDGGFNASIHDNFDIANGSLLSVPEQNCLSAGLAVPSIDLFLRTGVDLAK